MAYDLAIRVRGGGGRGVWPVVAAWLGGAVLVVALGWGLLRYFAYGVPTPMGS